MEELNGLSSFDVGMDIPYDLINIIEYFFLPPKRDLRDNPKNENSTNPSDNYDNEDNYDASHTCDIIPANVKNIQLLDLDKNKDHEIVNSTDADKNNDSSNI